MAMRSARLLALLALAGVAGAQQGAGPAPPPLMECGARNGDVEILCGTRSPEDLEPTPDGKFLIVSQFVNGRGGTGGAGLVLFDPAKKTFTKMTVKDEPRKDWGDPACPGPPGEALLPHGISLSKRGDLKNGAMQLYVVNHGGRQSMEMFELKRAGPSWELAWHGCFVTKQDYNDVAALADGGFIATQPTSLRTPGDTSNLLGGQATGYVVRWMAATGEVELPGTRIGYPNGVLVTPDGRYMYVNAWTAPELAAIVRQEAVRRAYKVSVLRRSIPQRWNRIPFWIGRARVRRFPGCLWRSRWVLRFTSVRSRAIAL
jgi:hypothetical protein